jgi:hypothetical protein
MNIKRFLEAKAGNLASFDRGMSYVPVHKLKQQELVASR